MPHISMTSRTRLPIALMRSITACVRCVCHARTPPRKSCRPIWQHHQSPVSTKRWLNGRSHSVGVWVSWTETPTGVALFDADSTTLEQDNTSKLKLNIQNIDEAFRIGAQQCDDVVPMSSGFHTRKQKKTRFVGIWKSMWQPAGHRKRLQRQYCAYFYENLPRMLRQLHTLCIRVHVQLRYGIDALWHRRRESETAMHS